jgi:hypothetical protein
VEGYRSDYLPSPSSSLSHSFLTHGSEQHEPVSMAEFDKEEEPSFGAYDEQLTWFKLDDVSDGGEDDERRLPSPE